VSCFCWKADVCHAYQILKKGGLKDENIIVFMYDDIAYNSENPYKGKIINKPDGPDVYEGVPKVLCVFLWRDQCGHRSSSHGKDSLVISRSLIVLAEILFIVPSGIDRFSDFWCSVLLRRTILMI
jgi:hypothetical protein